MWARHNDFSWEIINGYHDMDACKKTIGLSHPPPDSGIEEFVCFPSAANPRPQFGERHR
jgi:hypothetical protein